MTKFEPVKFTKELAPGFTVTIEISSDWFERTLRLMQEQRPLPPTRYCLCGCTEERHLVTGDRACGGGRNYNCHCLQFRLARPEPVRGIEMVYRTCTCTHSRAKHMMHSSQCNIIGCPCMTYVEKES